MIWSDLDQKLCPHVHFTGSSTIASTIQLPYGMMPKSTSEVKRWKIRGINLKYSVQRSYLASTSILYMRSYRLTRVVLATNNNLWNWPLWDMRYIIKVVTNLRRRFSKWSKIRVLALSSLSRKRDNELLNSTLFWTFFRSLVNFEAHCISKIDMILMGSWSFFSTIRPKISNLIDRNLYATVLNDVVYNIASNWVMHVMKKIFTWSECQFYS